MKQSTFKSRLLPNGYLYCPKEYAIKNLSFLVTVIPDKKIQKVNVSETFDKPPDVTKKPRFGSAKGMIEMSDDFDEPLDDFMDYMP